MSYYVILDLDTGFDYPELIGVATNKDEIDTILTNYFGYHTFTSARSKEDELEFERYGEVKYGYVKYYNLKVTRIVVLTTIK